MSNEEARLREIEDFATIKTDTYGELAIARALVEIARQLARIADALEDNKAAQ